MLNVEIFNLINSKKEVVIKALKMDMQKNISKSTYNAMSACFPQLLPKLNQ